ncbi:hypothetical protein ACFVVU_26955 [Kitasatospora sp. NPDC057965]
MTLLELLEASRRPCDHRPHQRLHRWPGRGQFDNRPTWDNWNKQGKK